MGDCSKFLKHQNINVKCQCCTGVGKMYREKSTGEDAQIVIFSLTVSSVNHDAMLQQAIFSIKVEIPTFSQWE